MPGWLKALGGFCALVLAANAVLVWQALRGHRDLVRKDYYQAGLDEDGRMARTALAESRGMRIAFRREGDAFRVEASRDGGPGSAPDPLSARVCRAAFYRPDDSRKDVSLELRRREADGVPGWSGAAPALPRGHWRVTLQWMDGAIPVMEKTLEYQSP